MNLKNLKIGESFLRKIEVKASDSRQYVQDQYKEPVPEIEDEEGEDYYKGAIKKYNQAIWNTMEQLGYIDNALRRCTDLQGYGAITEYMETKNAKFPDIHAVTKKIDDVENILRKLLFKSV